jgi:hypothetical protein
MGITAHESLVGRSFWLSYSGCSVALGCQRTLPGTSGAERSCARPAMREHYAKPIEPYRREEWAEEIGTRPRPILGPISGAFYRINERTPDMALRSKPGSDFWGHCTISMKAQVWRRASSRESSTLAHSPPHRRPRLVPV